LICEHKLDGEDLPNNIQIVAACNPFKKRKKAIEIGLTKPNIKTKLLYHVHPLCESIIPYVWDFGAISANL